MQEFVIRGGRPLHGTVRANGAKNAALPIMAASMLAEGTTVLHRVPRLSDVETMAAILRALGTELRWRDEHTLELRSAGTDVTVAPRELVRRMRASVCVLGPLLATRGAAALPLPGGCVIGERPIDLHLKGLRALGATIREDEHQVYARAPALRGTTVPMAGPRGSTVLGTANVLMAACLADGTTVIEHAACEPEVQDLAHFLTSCGAQVDGIGTRTLTITGCDHLQGCEHTLIPDRIEAGTYLIAGAITGGKVSVEDLRTDHMQATLRSMEQIGLEFGRDEDTLWAGRRRRLCAADITTYPYPGLPTDMQPQLSALLALAEGTSTVTEGVYPDRFTHMSAMCRMGARMVREGSRAVVRGVDRLSGTRVKAADLRAGAALVLAGLAAEGVTTVQGVDQIDRGYENLEVVLGDLGADISRREAEWAATPRLPAEGQELRRSA
ncbi:MAG: UDP-N-acetylglucosamine 1-carboxyvinyltransferase [Candidatus Brocadiia bacterium]